MAFTDIFIKRPVLSVVVSILILIVGARALQALNVRQYPEMQNAVITVSTVYVGADADLVRGFITVPLEREVASAEGIDYMESTSVPGVSIIRAFLSLDADPNNTLIQINEKVNKVRNELPQGSESPTISLAIGQTTSAMYMSFSSKLLDNNQITDYLTRVVQPQLNTIQGVQNANILGARTFAMRVWLKPERMAAYNITASEVRALLAANNVLAPVGKTDGNLVNVDFAASTDMHTAEEFRRLVLREDAGGIVRLGDVAHVSLGSESYSSIVEFNGKSAIFIGVDVAPDANLLDTIGRVRERFPDIKAEAPAGLASEIVYDSTEYVEDAIDEVISTIVEAMIIVIVVIYLFLGSVRTVLIPTVAVPLSLLGGCAIMLAMGFTLNLLTLLAMVLAIGMVVDDAIIIVENIHRHIEEGKSPKEAALIGARELVGPIIAMTVTLVAVYIPIGFRGGLTGALFTEFAFALAGSVLISGVVALTLSPMMCATMLKSHESEGWFARQVERFFGWVDAIYKDVLNSALKVYPLVLAFGGFILFGCYWLYANTPQQLAPKEDQGFGLLIMEGAATASIDYTKQYTDMVTDMIVVPEDAPQEQHNASPVENLFMFVGAGPTATPGQTNSGFGGIILKPWNEREVTTDQFVDGLRQKVGSVPGMRVNMATPPSLPSPSFFAIEVSIGSTGSVEGLYETANEIVGRAMQTGKFMFLQNDLAIDKPRKRIHIDRDKAAALGVTMQQVAGELASMLAGGHVNRFSVGGRSYKVIPQVVRSDRLNAEQLKNYYVRSGSGQLVSMDNLVSLEDEIEPKSLNRFQQLNSAKLTGMPANGVADTEALATLQAIANEVMPDGYVLDYAGQSRQIVTEGSSFLYLLLMAIVFIYLILAAQFESFLDPLIIIVTVPMAACGALLFLNVLSNPLIGFMAPGLSTSLNIFSIVGLMTLVGVISKHGILIVEFANELQTQGKAKREAILEACVIRLRPVLMTTVSLVAAMIPLLIATGPGAGARFSMGIVIASGMTLGTVFTLFVVPAVYLVLGRNLSGSSPV